MIKTLFKKDSRGNILLWNIQIVKIGFYVGIKSIYGLVNGALNSTEFEVKGKNHGKSNQTTAEEQAVLELNSMVKRKEQKGYKNVSKNKDFPQHLSYRESITTELINYLNIILPNDNTDANNKLKPMKAQQYYRSKKNWTDPTGKVWDDRKYYYLQNPYVEVESNAIIMKFPCLVQPKINGIRATISLNDLDEVEILSKEGKSYEVAHIKSFFESNKDIFFHKDIEESIIFDGELYIYNSTLQTIQSAVTGNNLYTPLVVFICFDLAIKTHNNMLRITYLNQQLKKYKNSYTGVGIIETRTALNNMDVQNYTDHYISLGYEGSILRSKKGLYAFGKRPMDMVKLKRVIDSEFKIIDVVSQKKNPDLGLFVCITKDGKEFEVTPKGTTEFKKLVLMQKHEYIGKPLTCTFYEYTEKGIPFHVIDNIVRDYE